MYYFVTAWFLFLCFVKCRDAVVSGKLPVTKDEATTLAALQCQIQYGNYDPMKHKPGWLPLNVRLSAILSEFYLLTCLQEFLAPQHLKIPEKNIYAEQKKLVGMSEV
jgi:talin